MFKGLNKKEQLLLLFLLLVIISGGLIKLFTKKQADIKIYKLESTPSADTNQPASKPDQIYEKKSDIDLILDQTSDIEKDKKIDINTATIPELDRLPGIGPVKAKSIVDYRKRIGGFNNLEQLKDVRGIGDKTFDAIKDSIYIKQTETPSEKQEFKKAPIPFQAPLEITKYPEFENLMTPTPKENKIVKETDETFEKININTADKKELCKLKGIGEKKAQAIIDYRKKYGKFEIPADIMKVKGIKQKIFLDNQDKIITQ